MSDFDATIKVQTDLIPIKVGDKWGIAVVVAIAGKSSAVLMDKGGDHYLLDTEEAAKAKINEAWANMGVEK